MVSGRLCSCMGDIACIRDRRIRAAGFPSGMCRLFVAELMYRTGAARRITLIAQSAYFGKDSVNGFSQGKLSERKASFVLECAGTELAPGIDMDGIGAAAATKKPVVIWPAE